MKMKNSKLSAALGGALAAAMVAFSAVPAGAQESPILPAPGYSESASLGVAPGGLAPNQPMPVVINPNHGPLTLGPQEPGALPSAWGAPVIQPPPVIVTGFRQPTLGSVGGSFRPVVMSPGIVDPSQGYHAGNGYLSLGTPSDYDTYWAPNFNGGWGVPYQQMPVSRNLHNGYNSSYRMTRPMVYLGSDVSVNGQPETPGKVYVQNNPATGVESASEVVNLGAQYPQYQQSMPVLHHAMPFPATPVVIDPNGGQAMLYSHPALGIDTSLFQPAVVSPGIVVHSQGYPGGQGSAGGNGYLSLGTCSGVCDTYWKGGDYGYGVPVPQQTTAFQTPGMRYGYPVPVTAARYVYRTGHEHPTLGSVSYTGDPDSYDSDYYPEAGVPYPLYGEWNRTYRLDARTGQRDPTLGWDSNYLYPPTPGW